MSAFTATAYFEDGSEETVEIETTGQLAAVDAALDRWHFRRPEIARIYVRRADIESPLADALIGAIR